jgi:hypothetical protein
VDLVPITDGFCLKPRNGVHMEVGIEHGEALFLVSCWCPGEPGEPLMTAERQRRSYVMTALALNEAWKHGELQVIKLGDAVVAGAA